MRGCRGRADQPVRVGGVAETTGGAGVEGEAGVTEAKDADRLHDLGRGGEERGRMKGGCGSE